MCAAISSTGCGRRAPRRWSNWSSISCSSFPASRAHLGRLEICRALVGYREVSVNSPAGIPIFQFKLFIVAAGILLLIQGIAQVFRCIICIRDGEWTRADDDVEETERQADPRARARNLAARRRSHRCRSRQADERAGDDRPASRPDDAGRLHLHHPPRLSDRLHADGDGHGLWLLRLFRRRPDVARLRPRGRRPAPIPGR